MRTKIHALAVLVLLLFVSQGTLYAYTSITSIPLMSRDIVYDNTSGHIYASVPSSAGVTGNRIAWINPVTATITGSAFVGSEPGKLAISDDGKYVYAALDGAAAVRKFDTTTKTAGLQFALGNSYYGPLYVEDMSVQPGNPDVIAVSRKRLGVSPRHGGVAVYDNGVMRPTTTADHTGSNVIAFGGSPSILYGYNTETTEYGFRTMSVNESGVAVTNVSGSLFSGFGGDIVYQAGRIYHTSGRVIDPVNRMMLGTYQASGIVVPDAAFGRVYFLSGSTIRIFDHDTFVPLGSIDVPGVSGNPLSFIRWKHGFAFNTSGNQLFLIQTEPVPEPGSMACLASLLGGCTFMMRTRRIRKAK